MVPGRRKEQGDVSGNRIYNKYNIAELQVQIGFFHNVQKTNYLDFRALLDTLTGHS